MNLQKAVLTFKTYHTSTCEESLVKTIDPRAMILVTVAYLIGLLSVPLLNPVAIIWFAIYPIIMAPMSNMNYSGLFSKSLYILPLILLIGIFNPIFDTRLAFKFYSINITAGWITFISLVIRGLLAMQALLILVRDIGFIQVCNGLRKFGIPNVMTVQLLMLYRYIIVLMEEGLTMQRAVGARGYGRKSFPIGLWTRLVGALLLRTLNRSRQITMAMKARGFEGVFRYSENSRWKNTDTLFTSIWISLFVFLRFFDLTQLFPF